MEAMFTFIAWSGFQDASAQLERVGAVLQLPVSHESHQVGSVGVAAWGGDSEVSRVQHWRHDRTGATVLPHAPIGGSAKNSLQLARILRKRPSQLVSALAPPFCILNVHDRSGQLTIANDGIGMTRLYQWNECNTWLWSNRPAALLAFAGRRARLDVEAWEQFAACGWFLGSSAPYEGVLRVAPSTLITSGGSRPTTVANTGALSAWCSPEPDRFDPQDAVEGLRAYARDLAHYTRGPYSVMLSGGRDSRVVAAVAIDAGLPMRLTTLGPIEGEIATARELVKRVGSQVDHRVRTPQPRTSSEPLRDRILDLHRRFDGDFTPIKMNSPPAQTTSALTLGGAGGEIAHANYYSSRAALESLEAKGLRAGVDRLDRHFRGVAGATDRGYGHAASTLEQWSDCAKSMGIVGAGFLDFFYLVERFRRWAPAAHTLHSYPMFAAPGFIRTAFRATPLDRVDGRLHSDIIRTLVPAWEGVPFFKASAGDRDFKSEHRLRIWQGDSTHEVDELLTTTSAWADVFDQETVCSFWDEAKQQGLPNRMEALFQRVLWRRVFEDHVSELNRILPAA